MFSWLNKFRTRTFDPVTGMELFPADLIFSRLVNLLGSGDAAKIWMESPHPRFEYQCPIELTRSGRHMEVHTFLDEFEKSEFAGDSASVDRTHGFSELVALGVAQPYAN